ncbi:hypothetical protein RHRU231_930019 [Rhodococcus ruber]|uniref:Uncharacterized protein n=1 Tax=Rhodococcus ruber TaxID=1830 RepID=A0A098BVA6_9NOCA|nr:hypothetical protein RHRU231_930019 [Rhodococcus ruber]
MNDATAAHHEERLAVVVLVALAQPARPCVAGDLSSDFLSRPADRDDHSHALGNRVGSVIRPLAAVQHHDSDGLTASIERLQLTVLERPALNAVPPFADAESYRLSSVETVADGGVLPRRRRQGPLRILQEVRLHNGPSLIHERVAHPAHRV